jgi:putative oxidoreductase
MGVCDSLLKLLARLALSAIFIFAGANKFLDYSGTAAFMASKQMPAVPFFLYAAAALEFFGGLMVLAGFKARWAALVLALFLIPVTYIFHDFWNVGGEQFQMQIGHFFSNLAVFGGLLYVVCCGSGRFSFDRD